MVFTMQEMCEWYERVMNVGTQFMRCKRIAMWCEWNEMNMWMWNDMHEHTGYVVQKRIMKWIYENKKWYVWALNDYEWDVNNGTDHMWCKEKCYANEKKWACENDMLWVMTRKR